MEATPKVEHGLIIASIVALVKAGLLRTDAPTRCTWQFGAHVCLYDGFFQSCQFAEGAMGLPLWSVPAMSTSPLPSVSLSASMTSSPYPQARKSSCQS